MKGAALIALALLNAPAQASEDALTLRDAGPFNARSWVPNSEDPAIRYESGPVDNRVSRLMADIAAGKTTLARDGASGYLPSLLAALGVSPTSQLLVISKTSLEGRYINPQNPRALYFSDDVVVSFVRGAPSIEIAVHDPTQGMVFYSLEQTGAEKAPLRRRGDCLRCHRSYVSDGIVGGVIRSVALDQGGFTALAVTDLHVDHNMPLKNRWGGWYVTGLEGVEHLGNRVLPIRDGKRLPDAVTIAAKDADLNGYLSTQSDAAALMVFDHQMRMQNLITRMGWDARVALAQQQRGATTGEVVDALMKSDVVELVDYMLFIDAAPVSGKFAASDFAKDFAARGPRDAAGRSLYQLDLKTRLLRFPCSYMIYSTAFDALPDVAKQAIYRRLGQVLSGAERDARYRKLAAVDHKAISELLRETKPDTARYLR